MQHAAPAQPRRAAAHPGDARDPHREGRHLRVARAALPRRREARAVPRRLQPSLRRGEPRDRHRADDPVPRHAHRDRAPRSLASISTAYFGDAKHADAARDATTSSTRRRSTRASQIDVPDPRRPRARRRSCRRSMRSRRRATSSAARRPRSRRPRCPPRARRGCKATSRASRKRSRSSPTRPTSSTPTPASRSACCSARRTSRSTTRRSPSPRSLACSRASRAIELLAVPRLAEGARRVAQGRRRKSAVARSCARRRVRGGHHDEGAADARRQGARRGARRPRTGARAVAVRGARRAGAARRDAHDRAHVEARGHDAAPSTATGASTIGVSPMPAAARPRRSRRSAGCARSSTDADLVSRSAGWARRRPSSRRRSARSRTRRAGRSSRCPAISRPRPRSGGDRGAARDAATLVLDGRLARWIELPGVDDRDDPRRRRASSGSSRAPTAARWRAGDVAQRYASSPRHRRAADRRDRGGTARDDGEPSGELALVPAPAGRCRRCTAGTARWHSRARQGGRDGRMPRCRRGPSTRRPACPRHAHRRAGLLVIRGGTWSWKPLVDESEAVSYHPSCPRRRRKNSCARGAGVVLRTGAVLPRVRRRHDARERARSGRADAAADDVVIGRRSPSADRRLSDSNQAWLGKIVDGRYRVLEVIGRGGMGVVYRVEHLRMGKIAAMKVLHRDLASDPEVVQRFEREAAAVSQAAPPAHRAGLRLRHRATARCT